MGAHARSELEMLLRSEGSVSDLRKAIGAANRVGLKGVGYSKLVTTAEQRLSDLESVEAGIARKEQERITAIRRAEAEERARVEAENKRRIMEEERLRKAEEKKLKERLEQERKERE